jgi:CBS domain-containing protein
MNVTTMAADQTVLAIPVRDAMRDVVSALAPDTTLGAAARLFVERHITGAPVVDAHGRILGVISQTDLASGPRAASETDGRNAFYVMLHGQPVIDATVTDPDHRIRGVVADVMTRHVIMVEPDVPLREAVRIMVASRIHRVLVVENGRLAGVVTSMDVLRLLAPDAQSVATAGF